MTVQTLCDIDNINISNLSNIENKDMLFLVQIVKYCKEHNIGDEKKISKLFNIFLNNLRLYSDNTENVKYNLELNITSMENIKFVFKPIIIILGEEYWFKNPQDEKYIEATYLLQYLEKNHDPRFEYKILSNPSQLTPLINNVGIENIKGLFLFQDVIADSYLNNMTLLEMQQYLTFLNSKIYLYPPLGVTNIFSSKKYYGKLVDDIKFASLPGSKVYFYKNYDSSMEYAIKLKLYKVILQMWGTKDKVVIKKGHSYEGKQVQVFKKDKIMSDIKEDKRNIDDEKKIKNAIFKRLNKLNYKKFWGVQTNSMDIDKGADRYYIVQYYNEIVTKGKNEYRVFFLNGVAKYITNGGWVANLCINGNDRTPIQREAIKFAEKLYKIYIKRIWNLKTEPILFRIDVSYAVDPIFQDRYSQHVEGFEDKIRIYANEMEIDPTSFLYNSFECDRETQHGILFSGENIQIEMGKLINKYIKTIA